jgi:hypothetical protein
MEPLTAFFAEYQEFDYNPSASATEEFERLSRLKGWGKRSKRRKHAKAAFRAGLVDQFNTSYGTDVNDIANWHAIMTRLGIDPLPDTVSECKKVCFRVSVQAEPWSKDLIFFVRSLKASSSTS